MGKATKHRILRIAASFLLIIIACVAGGAFWLARHYTAVLRDRLPKIVENSTDSIYHMSFTDIRVSYLQHNVTITGLQLTADTIQANNLRRQHRHIPTTLHNLTVKQMDLTGIAWGDLVSNHAFQCADLVVSGLKWGMKAQPHPEDSSFARDPKKKPFIGRIAAAHVTVINPNITYKYKGPASSFMCFVRGGRIELNKWAYNDDEKVDTSVFLYAQSGIVRPDTFILLKPTARYVVARPLLDFDCGAGTVALKKVKLDKLTDYDIENGNKREIYDLSFPEIALTGFNWNKLINDNTLAATYMKTQSPDINVHYLRAAAKKSDKMGSYPHQLLLQVALQTNLAKLDINNGKLRYVETTDKEKEATIAFTDINGTFANVTNIDSVIALHNSCDIKLDGKFMGKSPVSVTFKLGLADKKGKFAVDGAFKDLNGEDVLAQAQALSVVEVTSFHMSRMDIHEEGDESYIKGNFSVQYEDLKISLLKFKSNHRKGAKGPFSFLGSSLLLYAANPMPHEDVRKVTTSFVRDPEKGFINMIWKSIFYAAKKTALRSERLLILTDGKETQPGEKPAPKNFLKRLFSKRNKK